MNSKQKMWLQLLISLVFAVMIIVFSFLLGNKEYSDTLTFVLIALWWIPFTFLLSPKASNCEYKWMKRKVAGLINRG